MKSADIAKKIYSDISKLEKGLRKLLAYLNTCDDLKFWVAFKYFRNSIHC